MVANVESKLQYEVTAEESTAALVQAAEEYNAANPDTAVPIVWETLRAGIASNDPVVMGIIGMANHHSLDNEAAQKENGLSVAVYGIMNEEQQGNEILSHAAKFTQSFTDAYNTANGTEYAVSTNVEFGTEAIAAPHDPSGSTLTYPVINNSTWTHPVDENFDISGVPPENVIWGTGPSVTETVATYVTQNVSYQVAHTTYETRAEYSEEKTSKITSSLIPYMRAATLKYVVTGLKRDSDFNVFVDKINLSGHLTPATELTVSVTSGTFDAKSVAGSEDADIRKVDGNKVTALNVGDVIKQDRVVDGVTETTTAVLLGIEKTIGSDIILFVSNVKGTFVSSEDITGSMDSSSTPTATATITTVNTPTTAKSSAYGNLYGLLTIPNEGNKKLIVGDKEIIFTTSGISDLFSESFAVVDFTSTGTLMSTQPKITSIRNWVEYPVTTYSTESKTIQVRGDDKVVTKEGEPVATGVTSATAQWVCPVDPLCQTFFVEDETGIFVTAVDLYFGQKDTSNIPIYVSIVETINGYPGPNSFPLSEVYVDAEDVQVDTENTTTIDSRPYGNPTPTNIKFRAPVYLEGGKEYGIYIKSDSEKYVVWTSYMGEDDLSGGGSIQTQPLLGSLFKSQSASVWTTDQYEDLTFKLYRAEFDTGVGTFGLVNDDIPESDVSHVFGRTKTGSSLIRISLPNNGLNNGDSIEISGLEAGTYAVDPAFKGEWTAISYVVGDVVLHNGSAYICIANAASVNEPPDTAFWTLVNNYVQGIDATDINATHIVSNVENDFFVIDPGVLAGSSEYLIQKFGLKITKNIKIDVIKPAFKDKIIPGTNLEYEYKHHSDASPTKLVNRFNKSTPSTISVLNPVGETAQGASSLEFTAKLSTEDARVSPIINIAGIDALCSTNRINSPDVDDISTDLDVSTFTSTALTQPTLSSITTTNSTTTTEFGKFKIGMNLHIYDGTSSGTDLGNFIITDISDDKTTVTVDSEFTMTGTTLYIVYNTRYLDEIAPMGSTSVSKYVSRPLQFVNISTGFKLFFTYNQPYNTNIDFYYRTSNSGVEGVSHKSLKYTKIDNIGTKSSNNKGGFFEGNTTVTGVDDYDIISVKIVFNSADSNKTPRLRDFRIVAVA
jgi:hypothetical protein